MIIETFGKERFDFVKLTNNAYNKQRKEFYNETGVLLPTFQRLKVFGKLKDLRILVNPLTVTVIKDSTEIIQVKFKTGFITDLASTPNIIRGLIDNDDPQMLPAVLLHDYHFTTHYLSFRNTNKLFKKTLIESGYNRLKSFIAYTAVNSIFARRRWNKAQKRMAWTLATTERFEHN